MLSICFILSQSSKQAPSTHQEKAQTGGKTWERGCCLGLGDIGYLDKVTLLIEWQAHVYLTQNMNFWPPWCSPVETAHYTNLQLLGYWFLIVLDHQNSAVMDISTAKPLWSPPSWLETFPDCSRQTLPLKPSVMEDLFYFESIVD